METIKYELKYCEGCGTLKLRPVLADIHHCRVCERMLTRFRFPWKMLTHGRGVLPHLAGLKRSGGRPYLTNCATNAGGPQ